MARTIRLAACVLMAGLSAAAAATSALPTGGTVMQGAANIGSSGTTMTITQTTDRAVINWTTFDVGANATVTFIQPTAQAAVLNRVIGANASQIDGAISANGQVFFVNPNGITFGRGAQVDAAAVVASTLDIADSAFLSGDMTFSGNTRATIENYGRISTTAANGYIALLAPVIRNAGYLVATVGAANTIVLGSGNQVRIRFNGTSVLDVTVDEASYQNLVENTGTIITAGGSTLIPVSVATSLYESAINNSGTISADSATSRGGLVELLAQKVVLTGTISANSQVDRGGDIRIAGVQSVDLYGQVTANSANLNGGNITIGGAITTVHTGAAVTAQGNTGGGVIRFGDVQNVFSATDVVSPIDIISSQINVQVGASVDVSATRSGAGGTIALQADNASLGGIFKADAAGTAAGGSVTVNLRDQLGLEQFGQLSISTLGTPVGGWHITAQQVVINGHKPVVLAELFEKEDCLEKFRDILAHQYTTGSVVTIEQASSTVSHKVDAVTPPLPPVGMGIGQERIEEEDLPEKKSSAKTKGDQRSSAPPDKTVRATNSASSGGPVLTAPPQKSPAKSGSTEGSSTASPTKPAKPATPRKPLTPTKPASNAQPVADQPKQNPNESPTSTEKISPFAATFEGNNLPRVVMPDLLRLPSVNPSSQKTAPPLMTSEDGHFSADTSKTTRQQPATFDRLWADMNTSGQQSGGTKKNGKGPINQTPQSVRMPESAIMKTSEPDADGIRQPKEAAHPQMQASGKNCGSCDTVNELENLTSPQKPSPPNEPPLPKTSLAPPPNEPLPKTSLVPPPNELLPKTSLAPPPNELTLPKTSLALASNEPSGEPSQPPGFKPPTDIPPVCLMRLSSRLKQLNQSKPAIQSATPPASRHLATQTPAAKTAPPATQQEVSARAAGGDGGSPDLGQESNVDETAMQFDLSISDTDFERAMPASDHSVAEVEEPTDANALPPATQLEAASATVWASASKPRQPGSGRYVTGKAKPRLARPPTASSPQPTRARPQSSDGDRSDRQRKSAKRPPKTTFSLPSVALRGNASTPKGSGALPSARTRMKSSRPGIHWRHPRGPAVAPNEDLNQSCERYWPELKAEYERAGQGQ